MLNISLENEYIFSFLGVSISNTFFTAVLVTILLIGLSLYFDRHITKKSFTVDAVRVMVYELLSFIDSVTGSRLLSKRVLPFIGTLFVFIVSANLLALVPGFLGSFYVLRDGTKIPLLRSANSDLTVTTALAIFTVVTMQFYSLQTHGVRRYLSRYFNFSGFIALFMGFFELLSEITKVISFSFRLFGNIFAGELLLLVIAFLVPYILPVPFMIMEVFVGVVQAFVFAMLSLSFIKIDIAHGDTDREGVR